MRDCDVVVFLIQSLFSRSAFSPLLDDRDAMPPPFIARKLKSGEPYSWHDLASFGLVCVDEAHRIVSATALPCLAMFPNAKIVCATATPDRNDSTHDVLGPVFGAATAIL